MEKIYEKTLLYDFYGELLTSHQRSVYESVVFNDMSLSEAAEEFGVSRQGIHDMLRRCDKALADYEKKLHMVEQFATIRSLAETVEAESRDKTISDSLFRSRAKKNAERILREIS